MSGKPILFVKMGVRALLLFGVMVAFLAQGKASAEFYTYEDRKGTIHFVEDLAKIPREYRHKKQVRKDEYDDLSADELLLGRF